MFEDRREKWTFQPDILEKMQAAFDSSWAETAPKFRGMPHAAYRARIKLARTIVARMNTASTVDELKREGLSALALHYRWHHQ